MKLLLTSAGASNDSIRAALVELLGKPIEEASAVAVPTAMYAYPEGVRWGWESIKSFADMGWREMGVLELTALPTLEDAHWLSVLEAADAILVGGGVTGYLSYWFQESGLAERLPPLLRRGLVYVGVSAGSMVATPGLNVDRERLATTGVYYDDEYDEGSPAGAGSDAGLGLVDFAIRPHLGSEDFPVSLLRPWRPPLPSSITRSTPSTTRRLSRSSATRSRSSPKVSGTDSREPPSGG